MSTNKSFSTETAERYSRALFEVSEESSQLDKVENDVKNFQSLYNSSSDINNFLKDPTQSNNNQNEVINLLTNKLGFSKDLKNFFLLLIQKRRIFFIKKIMDSFLKLCSKKRGETSAFLISSRKLSQSDLDLIRNDLSKATGSNLRFDFKVDESLIEGLKLQLGSFMIDTSIKSKLRKYELAMLEN